MKGSPPFFVQTKATNTLLVITNTMKSKIQVKQMLKSTILHEKLSECDSRSR